MVVSHFKFFSTDNNYEKIDGEFGDACANSYECTSNFECINDVCACNTFYTVSDDNQYCRPYPVEGEKCTGYCSTSDLICNANTKVCEYREIFIPQNDAFITASQVALSAALVMGIAALAMVIYRLCTKPKYLNARQRAESARLSNLNSANFNEQNAFRSSLSSIQVRVLSRLQDRPPAYNGESPRMNSPVNHNIPAETPPPYFAGTPQDLHLHQPPSYTEIVLCPNAYVNQSFTETEQPRTIAAINNNETNNNIENKKNMTIKK